MWRDKHPFAGKGVEAAMGRLLQIQHVASSSQHDRTDAGAR